MLEAADVSQKLKKALSSFVRDWTIMPIFENFLRIPYKNFKNWSYLILNLLPKYSILISLPNLKYLPRLTFPKFQKLTLLNFKLFAKVSIFAHGYLNFFASVGDFAHG